MPSTESLNITDATLAVYCNNAVNRDREWALLDEAILHFVRWGFSAASKGTVDRLKLFRA